MAFYVMHSGEAPIQRALLDPLTPLNPRVMLFSSRPKSGGRGWASRWTRSSAGPCRWAHRLALACWPWHCAWRHSATPASRSAGVPM